MTASRSTKGEGKSRRAGKVVGAGLKRSRVKSSSSSKEKEGRHGFKARVLGWKKEASVEKRDGNGEWSMKEEEEGTPAPLSPPTLPPPPSLLLLLSSFYQPRKHARFTNILLSTKTIG